MRLIALLCFACVLKLSVLCQGQCLELLREGLCWDILVATTGTVSAHTSIHVCGASLRGAPMGPKWPRGPVRQIKRYTLLPHGCRISLLSK